MLLYATVQSLILNGSIRPPPPYLDLGEIYSEPGFTFNGYTNKAMRNTYLSSECVQADIYLGFNNGSRQLLPMQEDCYVEIPDLNLSNGDEIYLTTYGDNNFISPNSAKATFVWYNEYILCKLEGRSVDGYDVAYNPSCYGIGETPVNYNLTLTIRNKPSIDFRVYVVNGSHQIRNVVFNNDINITCIDNSSVTLCNDSSWWNYVTFEKVRNTSDTVTYKIKGFYNYVVGTMQLTINTTHGFGYGQLLVDPLYEIYVQSYNIVDTHFYCNNSTKTCTHYTIEEPYTSPSKANLYFISDQNDSVITNRRFYEIYGDGWCLTNVKFGKEVTMNFTCQVDGIKNTTIQKVDMEGAMNYVYVTLNSTEIIRQQTLIWNLTLASSLGILLVGLIVAVIYSCRLKNRFTI